MLGVDPTIFERLDHFLGELTERGHVLRRILSVRSNWVAAIAQQFASGLRTLPGFSQRYDIGAAEPHLPQLLRPAVAIDEDPATATILPDRQIEAATVTVAADPVEAAHLQCVELVKLS